MANVILGVSIFDALRIGMIFDTSEQLARSLGRLVTTVTDVHHPIGGLWTVLPAGLADFYSHNPEVIRARSYCAPINRWTADE